jgi:hypothetical protein
VGKTNSITMHLNKLLLLQFVLVLNTSHALSCHPKVFRNESIENYLGLKNCFERKQNVKWKCFLFYCYQSDNNTRKSAKLKSSLVLTGLKKKTGLSHMQALKAA